MIISGATQGVYTWCFLLALFINSILMVKFLRKEYDIGTILGFLFYENFGFILGAKVLSYFADYPKYDSILDSGMSAYGALIGGFLMIYIFCLEFKLPLIKFFTKYVILLPLIYAIGKLGCFFGGCCYGVECSLPISVVYLNSMDAPNNISLFPVQLVESIVNFIIFVWLILEKKSDMWKIGWTFVLCGLSKFILDFFRASWAYSISVNQWISIFLCIIGINIILTNLKKKKI